MRTAIYCVIATVAFCLVDGRAEAQFGGYAGLGLGAGSGVVAGTGVVTIERQPEQMRLEISILSRAETLEAALSGLKDRSAAARAQLLVLGVRKDSLKLGQPEIKGSSAQDQQIEQMLAARLRRGRTGAKSPKKNEDKPVTVSAVLSAAWDLKSETAEDLLLEIGPLQTKIKEADLSGQKEASKLSPEQQEIIDEFGGPAAFGTGGSGEAKPGEPVFLFAAEISEEQRDRALADGFQKAKKSAARLARAAGSELGELTSLSASSSSSRDNTDYGYNYNSPLYQAMLKAQTMQQEDTDSSTALSALPGTILLKLTVQAAFGLKKD